jgi:hypothetical protein
MNMAESENKPPSALAEELLPVIARQKLVQGAADRIGASMLYDVEPGWESDFVQQDHDVTVVSTPREMERAFNDQETKTVFIPAGSAITREVASRICERSALNKTVFYETNSRAQDSKDEKGGKNE